MDKKNHYHQDMLSVEEARKKILGNFTRLSVESTPILKCLGMTLAKDIISPINVPPLNNSAMDGYAIISLDTKNKILTNLLELEVIGTVAAGEISDKTIQSGQALRIMTGAPIPSGSDAVVPFEKTDEQKRKLRGSSDRKISIMAKVDSGENIRFKGEDIFAGATVLHKNKIIRPADIGVAASIGLTHLPVIRRPVIAIFSTGNELVEPGNKLNEGKIYNSNAFTIASMVSSYGGLPKIIDTAEDSFQAVNEAI
ncbi:MAG: molybdopterin molybdotransferase MoeA, partial [SAR202 cluster bacterium]|nr:molybdopterin molybdotransferase MoeA [SAR202 cluster bacterium]